MTETVAVPQAQADATKSTPFRRWLLEGYLQEMEGPHEREGAHKQHPWWQVMCLTGVDYFSTLGYQPGIAALAAGAVSPFATMVLILLTLFGALPIYRWVARESSHGEGSIAMLAHHLSAWRGKLLILVLLGFVATDFIITITLSAADASAHIIENPLAKRFIGANEEAWQISITLFLIAGLGAVFLKGFKEAIGIAVFLVAAYLLLNAVVLGRGIFEVWTHPEKFSVWWGLVTSGQWVSTIPTSGHNQHNPFVNGAALLLFPKLALGLSGFETGVAVMPLVKGDEGDTEQRPKGRIRNTRHLLMTAALIMCVYLLCSSFVTTILIPFEEFRPAAEGVEKGEANGRALAYLAHQFFGDWFGTVYDLSTIAILWFAGASAMAGLLNIVPRYLPRYGMAPNWTRAIRPLVFIFTITAFVVTIIFKADVDAQGGAYATGVLVLMTSAAVATVLSVRRMVLAKVPHANAAMIGFGLITLVFLYTTVVNVIERPDGVKIAAFFIASIIGVSLISRVVRTTELRADKIQLDDAARQYIADAMLHGELRLIANNPDRRDVEEYRRQSQEARLHHMIPPTEPMLFLEVYVKDASDFSGVMQVHGAEVEGYRILRVDGVAAIPNAIAALLLHLRDRTGKRPHAYFNWTEGNPFIFLVKYLLLGQGDVAPVTHEVLRVAEPNPERRPAIHVGF
jgi:hypothetical protein